MNAMSFITPTPKMIVVVNPAELYPIGPGRGKPGGSASRAKAKGKTKSKPEAAVPPEQRCVEWIERSLIGSGHRMILLAFEDEAEGREVNEKSGLFLVVAQRGYPQRFRDNKAFFRIEEALVSRDATGLLRAIEELWTPREGNMKVYGSVLRAMRLMLQAGIVRDRNLLRDPAAAGFYFPNARGSLMGAPPNVRDRYLRGGSPFRTGDLLRAFQELLRVYEALRPQSGELYVPDQRALLERILLELIASPRPVR
jgi:hypothetical protein